LRAPDRAELRVRLVRDQKLESAVEITSAGGIEAAAVDEMCGVAETVARISSPPVS
jgi:hypothetical protein